jgi:oxygen-dependent protoporphyrinogen oxidase
VKVVVVGGGIAGLAAARALEGLMPDVEILLLERSPRVGGVLRTEHVDGFLVECGPDSFLSRKPRGVGLCEELGLGDELIGRRPENARSFVRLGDELHPLPEGLTGLVPTDLDALERSTLLSPEGKRRLAAEADLPPARSGEDESIASFVTRRLGREAYERLVEPLTTGIYGGDGEQLSLQATFPQLRALELEHGSLLRGLRAQAPSQSGRPPFVGLRSGIETLARAVAGHLRRTNVRVDADAVSVRTGYALELEGGEHVQADGVVLATPAYVGAELVSELDPELAGDLAEIPYAGSAIVTLGYRGDDVAHPLDGYGYVVPRSKGSNIHACTWSSSKWEGRAPDGRVVLRVFAGSEELADEDLVALARDEVTLLGIRAEPVLTRIDRWPRGMPQYTLGHMQRLERIDSALSRHPGLAYAGAAYRGVGIPDCIHSGEEAARSLARSLTAARNSSRCNLAT